MNQNDTIRLLILNDSRQEAERLISMLRTAGRAIRAQHAESEEILTKLLEEQGWDLLIVHDKSKVIPAQQAIKIIRRLGKDVPAIFISDDGGTQSIVAGMKLGAIDVVKIDEDQHLLFALAIIAR